MQCLVGKIRRLKNRRQVEDLPAVLRAIADVQVPIDRAVVLVSLMDVVRARVKQRDNGQPNAVRPRVIRIDVDLLARTPPGFQ